MEGLTEQAGGSVRFDGVTWQLRFTVLAKPLTVPIVMLEAEVPSGSTAGGEKEEADRVKLACANAEVGNAKRAANRQTTAILADIDVSDFNMSRFRFK